MEKETFQLFELVCELEETFHIQFLQEDLKDVSHFASISAIIDDLLEREHVRLVIKRHPFQDKNSVRYGYFSNIILLDNHELYVMDIQINQLLPLADALIGDYSSAAVDYLLLNCPIAFTLEDMEEYAQSRGFVFDSIRDWLSGKGIFIFEDFCEFVIEVSHGKDSMKEENACGKRCINIMTATAVNGFWMHLE